MMLNNTLILSTCGTSLLTNLAGSDQSLRQCVIRYANAAEKAIPDDDRKVLSQLLDRARRELKGADATRRSRFSAELNGLQLLENEPGFSGSSLHWLIATDTWLGRQSASCIADVLEQQGKQVEVKPVPGLRTDDRDSFRVAVAELSRLCAQEVKNFHDSHYRIVFNLTGGFKAVQGFMQALGMLYADDTVYVFERTDKLLHIPRLPVEMDALRTVREHQRVFRKLALDLPVDERDLESLPKTLYEQADELIDFSVWGRAIWEESRDTLLEERLWESVSDKLRYGPGFEKSVEDGCKHQSDRLRLVNERLMQLARHLEGSGCNPSGLDFKKLKGKHDPWTHECDAWSDKDARRLFGHFEGETFVLDALGKHLR